MSGIGGMFSIGVLFSITASFEQGLHWNIILVASMGATAVLLFATPRVAFAQPWNIIGGHMISALIGVIIYKVVPNLVLASALAAGLAITAMYYLRCLHPPGGATALVAVIGGEPVHELGMLYVLFPIGIGALLMVLIAIAFNYPHEARRYPANLFASPGKTTKPYPDISHADFVAALAQMDSYVDISEEDLLRIYAMATQNHEILKQKIPPNDRT